MTTDNTQLTPMKSFEETIKDKLTADIGTLIPDDALTALIEKSIERLFFSTRTVTTGTGFHKDTKQEPSVFHDVLNELLEPMARTVMKKWMDDNAELVAGHLKTFIETNAEQAVLTSIAQIFSGAFSQMHMNVVNEMSHKIQTNQLTQY